MKPINMNTFRNRVLNEAAADLDRTIKKALAEAAQFDNTLEKLQDMVDDDDLFDQLRDMHKKVAEIVEQLEDM